MAFFGLLTHNGRGVLCTSAAVVFLAIIAPFESAHAQTLRGSVRLKGTEQTVSNAKLTAEDRQGRKIGEAISNEEGQFQIRISGREKIPFRVTVSRLGLRPSMSAEMILAAEDTIHTDLWTEVVPILLEEVALEARPSYNTILYTNALKRGWRVVDPETVEARRNTSVALNDMLRSLGIPGIIVPQRHGQCIRTTRYRECLQIVLDGVLVGTEIHMNPRDIYFLALVNSTEARIEWGERAAYGALAIYTRMHGDTYKPHDI